MKYEMQQVCWFPPEMLTGKKLTAQAQHSLLWKYLNYIILGGHFICPNKKMQQIIF